MSGTKAGGKKIKKTILDRYGKDFWAENGRKGGLVSTGGGFASICKKQNCFFENEHFLGKCEGKIGIQKRYSK